MGVHDTLYASNTYANRPLFQGIPVEKKEYSQLRCIYKIGSHRLRRKNAVKPNEIGVAGTHNGAGAPGRIGAASGEEKTWKIK